MRCLLRTSDLSIDDLESLMELSALFKRRPGHCPQVFSHDTVVLYLQRPSTRTRLSFETAVARLGGTPLQLGPTDFQLGGGETPEDAARTISRYAAAFVARTDSDEELGRFAAASSIPVVNALTSVQHPMQSLADLMTLWERFGELDQLPVAYVGDGNNVCHSLMEVSAMAGVQLTVATPPGYEPEAEVVASAAALADKIGARLTVITDPEEAVAGARVVYTGPWLSADSREAERTRRRSDFATFQVNERLMNLADPEAIFMHCLPYHRGEEVTAGVMDGPQSVVFDQAENRLHTAVAVLYALAEELLVGAG